MKKRFILTLFSLILVIVLLATPVVAATSIFDDFNRADGPLGPNWTDQSYTMEISNMKAQAGSPLTWSAATYDGGTGTVLEGDVQSYGNSLQFTGFVLNYKDNSNALLIKIQDNTASGGFNSLFFYYGVWPFPSMQKYWHFYSEPFTTAHMKVELVESTATITFSNIDGGTGTRTYVWDSVPTTGGTGVGIAGYKNDTYGATMDNFSASTLKTPPGWDKGKKSGWDGSVPPGLQKKDKTPPGFDQGNKNGWDNTID